MTGGLTGWSIVLLAFVVTAEVGRELNFKAAVLAADKNSYVASLIRQPVLWFGLVLWTAEIGAWLLALTETRLAIAFPISTLSYAGVPLAASLVLGERSTPRQRLGMGMIVFGVISIALSELTWPPR